MHGGHHHVGRGERRDAVPGRQRAHPRLAERSGAEVEPPVAGERGDGVRTVPTGVHPDRPSDRARNADRPFEAAQARRRRPPGQHGEAHRRSGHHVGAVDRQLVEPTAKRHDETREPAVRHQQVRTAPQDQHGDVPVGESRGDRGQLRLVHRLDVDGGRAPDPIGRERPQRVVASGQAPERPCHRVQVLEYRSPRRRLTRHHVGSAMSSSGSDVRSPAPNVQQRSPGRSRSESVRRSSARVGA